MSIDRVGPRMSDVNRVELCRRIRANRRWLHIVEVMQNGNFLTGWEAEKSIGWDDNSEDRMLKSTAEKMVAAGILVVEHVHGGGLVWRLVPELRVTWKEETVVEGTPIEEMLRETAALRKLSREMHLTRAYILCIGRRFFVRFGKAGQVQIAWSLAGAKFFREKEPKIAARVAKKGYVVEWALAIALFPLRNTPEPER